MPEYRVAPSISLKKFAYGLEFTESDSRYHLRWGVGCEAQLLRRFVLVQMCGAYVLEDFFNPAIFALSMWNTTSLVPLLNLICYVNPGRSY
jgi:hypothetical protein